MASRVVTPERITDTGPRHKNPLIKYVLRYKWHYAGGFADDTP